MSVEQDDAYVAVEEALLGDPDADVTEADGGFAVKGRRFVSRSDAGDLVVLLPAGRAADLVTRGIATEDRPSTDPVGAWVVIADTEDWVELAGEAHEFVGEPAVGRDS